MQRGMRKRFAALVLTLVTFIAAAPHGIAAQQRIDSPYRFLNSKQEASLFGGYLSSSKGTLGIGPKPAPTFGARYTIMISGPFALEGGVSYFSSTRAVYDTVPGDTTRKVVGDADFTTYIGTASLRFNLTGPRTWHGILPYVLFGLGVAVDGSSASPAETDLATDARFDFGTSFMGLLGGGAELSLGQRFALRLDARNLLWKLKTPTAFLVKGEQSRLLPGDEWAQNLGLTAGLTFRF
jgi:Outer membrane protein beta-barrel domain